MFFSDSILAKKGGGALAKVWLAAHWERKLSKAQFIQTNITVSVGAIVGETGQPMALRLSGQLLLGVVRIYSRKARYLLEDCNEALVKIKMAFRPGVVDMPDEQATAHFNAITLSETINEFDILLPEPAFNLNNFNSNTNPMADLSFTQQSQSQQDTTIASSQQTNVSRQADITIRDTTTRHSLALPSASDALDLLDMEHGMEAVGDEEEILSFDFGGDASVAPSTAGGFPGFDIGSEASAREIEVGRENVAADRSFQPDFSLDESGIVGMQSKGKERARPDNDEDVDMDRMDQDMEMGLENRMSSAGILDGGIDEMSFAMEEGIDKEPSRDFGNSMEEDFAPFNEERQGDDDFAPMGADPFMDEKENDEANAMFDVATTPVGNKLNVIKKNVVASAKKKTPAKRAPKPRGEVMSAPATKRRKVVVPDELTEIPTKQIMDQLADTTAITVMETYLPTSQRTIDLLAARKNRDYLKPMHSGLNPKLSALFSTNEIMPLGPVKFTKNDNVDGASSVRSIRESLVIVNREKSASLEEEEEDAELDRIEPEQNVLRREVDEVSDRASEVPAGNFDTYDAASSNGWDDRAFPADEDFAPMEDASLALPSVHEPSMQKASSARASVEPLPSRPVLTEEELSVQEVAQSENEYFQDLVEDESVAPEEEADVSLTNGESMSRSTMTTIELLQHKFSRSKSLTLNQLLPKKPKKPEAARMFFEMLVLKTKNLIDVEQNEAYGTIKLTEMPMLSAQIAA